MREKEGHLRWPWIAEACSDEDLIEETEFGEAIRRVDLAALAGPVLNDVLRKASEKGRWIGHPWIIPSVEH